MTDTERNTLLLEMGRDPDLRRELKERIDRIKRERTQRGRRIEQNLDREIGKRMSEEPTNAKMPTEDVKAAYRSIVDGVPLDTIVNQLWLKYAFSTQGYCRKSLLTRFAALGLRLP